MNKIKGSYYLHTNGKMIWKNRIVYANDPTYFASPFVVAHWEILENISKSDLKTILTDALIKGALPLEIKRIGLKNGLTEKDIEEIYKTKL